MIITLFLLTFYLIISFDILLLFVGILFHNKVYRKQTKKFVRFQPTTTLKLDRHCQVTHPGYEIKNGIVVEVPHKTPQADDPNVSTEEMTYTTRASGDGTVAYWSLRWPITWRKQGYTVEPVEVEGAGHRDILEKPECLEAVLS